MSVKRIILFIVCVIVAGMLLGVALPLVGIPQSHFLPPAQVYAGAKGRTTGVITGKYREQSGNPLRSGHFWYFLTFTFSARAPQALGEPKPGVVRQYKGSVVVDKSIHDSVQIGQRVPVKYETTYPYINGIDDPRAGRSSSEGSALLSGWLLWVLATLVLGYALMTFASGFLKPENL